MGRKAAVLDVRTVCESKTQAKKRYNLQSQECRLKHLQQQKFRAAKRKKAMEEVVKSKRTRITQKKNT